MRAAAPFVSITDHKRKVVYARLGDELRVAGMADITNYRADLDPARIEVLVRQVRQHLSRQRGFQPREPVVRAAPRHAQRHAGASAARATPICCSTSATARSGFTLACGCGKIIADLAAGREPEISLDGFTLA